jgi:hypothetical protein
MPPNTSGADAGGKLVAMRLECKDTVRPQIEIDSAKKCERNGDYIISCGLQSDNRRRTVVTCRCMYSCGLGSRGWSARGNDIRCKHNRDRTWSQGLVT